jgi:hypothetical protein
MAMSYELILTADERKAIDWVGNRDWNGYDLSDLLLDCLSDTDEWNSSDGRPIKFIIPEHIAWDIMVLYEDAENGIPHFSLEFAAKIQQFLDSIV